MAEQEFVDSIYDMQRKCKTLSKALKNKEVTKMSLVLPFLECLGYSLKKLGLIVPEYPSGINNEKVDFVIMNKANGTPNMLLICKHVDQDVKNTGHISHLRKYYNKIDGPGVGILTNGINYDFYTNVSGNLMEDKPFFEFNLLSFEEESLDLLEMFSKDVFDLAEIRAKMGQNVVKTQVFEAITLLFAEKSFGLVYNFMGLIKDKGVLGLDEDALYPYIIQYFDNIVHKSESSPKAYIPNSLLPLDADNVV